MSSRPQNATILDKCKYSPLDVYTVNVDIRQLYMHINVLVINGMHTFFFFFFFVLLNIVPRKADMTTHSFTNFRSVRLAHITSSSSTDDQRRYICSPRVFLHVAVNIEQCTFPHWQILNRGAIFWVLVSLCGHGLCRPLSTSTSVYVDLCLRRPRSTSASVYVDLCLRRPLSTSTSVYVDLCLRRPLSTSASVYVDLGLRRPRSTSATVYVGKVNRHTIFSIWLLLLYR